MNVPRQRNPGPQAGEPVRVGDRQDGGEVWASISARDAHKVIVGVAHLGGQAVEVSRDDAETLYHRLGRMLGLE